MQIYKLLCEYRFKPNLLFYDVKGQIGDALGPDYPHWETDGLRIKLYVVKQRRVLAIEHNRLVLEWDRPDSIENFQTFFVRAYREYTDRVKTEDYRRLGFRAQCMIPVEMKFEELVEISNGKFLSQNPGLRDLLGEKIDDYMYNVLTEKNGRKLHVVCGPVKKAEIPQWFQPASMVQTAEEHTEEIQYPDVAFYMDCDYYINNPTGNDPKDFLDDAIRALTSVTKGLESYVFGE